ncbi:MAG: hypothetical protein JNL82_38010 [Myxococcales bacterium]|nr:hypothetical protein [Myxococcales bacterium]
MLHRVLLPILCALPLASCSKGHLPKPTETRDSGQSGLMGETFAGKNNCNPKNHLRPFIIEWDATDMSSFESYAANDIVIVRYEGCELQILDECRNDSIRGSQGAYKPVEWTTGSLEKINIANQGELYAKLPLGAATLGGRVAGGEKFSMEYYVAGTRNATRDAVYSNDIASNPGCEGATHFVYGYNLGAFALGSAKDFNAEVNASVYGFGAGGKTSKTSQADKKGGDLAVCKSDSATEIAGCKAPIRLTLRGIRDGENPEKTAMKAEDTPESLNAAGQVNQKIEMSEEARAYWESAQQKANARDGKGCLAELDKHDKVDPKHKSTDSKSYLAYVRSQCLMLSGKCDAGKQLMRQFGEQNWAGQTGPEHVDRTVEAMLGLHCQGKMSPRDTVLQALMQLQQGAYQTKKTPEVCKQHYDTVKKLKGQVKPKDDEDTQILNIDNSLYYMAASCIGRAGDCKLAWEVFLDGYPMQNLKNSDEATKQTILKSNFESMVQKCKEKKAG